ncbi:MAG: hypothetical protein A3E79_03575 [Burkholderiales bacterium RIFCSPHIGHO2_12_FULL_61_11]|nr:MAG: hypothetical protein A3E79_03575 [Burkholderiales bacterium RIFCSPHIGHO2_12_FULL_61_11]
MIRPRSALISLGDTAWYRCVSRCVRRGKKRIKGARPLYLWALATKAALDEAGLRELAAGHFPG